MDCWLTILTLKQWPLLCFLRLTVQACTFALEQTNILRDTETKHELICVSVVSPILNPSLWPRPKRCERILVFINRQREKGKREGSPVRDWNHMELELVESNPSCDNIACPTTPHSPPVPLCLMSQPFTKDCNWRRSIGGWGQEQSDRDFQKVYAGSEEEMVLPPNTQLHVITIIQPWRMVYSILL